MAQRYATQCPHCGQRIAYLRKVAGQERPCIKCGRSIRLPAVKDAAQPPAQAAPPPAAEPDAASKPPTIPEPAKPLEPPPAPPPSPEESLPERMKANRLLEGRMCPGCDSEIELSQDVHNCRSCGTTMHLECRERLGGCGRSGCSEAPASAPAAAATQPIAGTLVPKGGAAEALGGPRAECRFCGESITVGSRKCPYCGEFQAEADRRLYARRKAASDTDARLQPVDYVMAFLCPNIACIVGIVYAVQSKPKGWKLILLQFAGQAVWFVIANVVNM